MHLKGVIQAKPSNRHGRIRVSHEKEACKYVKPSYIDDEAKLDDHDALFIFSDLLGKTNQNLIPQILFFCITCFGHVALM